MSDMFTAIDFSAMLRWLFTGTYLAALAVASVYGLHRYWLVVLYRRTRSRTHEPLTRFSSLPRVTVQLPMFNEAPVAERIIEAACRIEYPRDRLQIQVLDDSTDECAAITRACVERLQAEGHDIHWLHRRDRVGYKAGALQHGLDSATGEFLAIFDADFVPPPQFLLETIHHFTDERVGMVQAAWDHLNADNSLLTRCQAVYLDSHFQIEHPARDRHDCWFNFNGTAGIWRRAAIETSGGWQHDTLTEDMDLSYRAQLAGWQFAYMQALLCPAELPPEINAFKTQQHRWTKGTVQTAKKLLGRVFRARATLRQKREAIFHLTSPIVYPCVLVIALLMYPAVVLNLGLFDRGSMAAGLFGLMILLLATVSGCAFYAAGQFVRGRELLPTLAALPALIALGVGMCVKNSLAVFEAVLGRQSPFVRTPKFNRATLDGNDIVSACTNRQRSRVVATQMIPDDTQRFAGRMHLSFITCIEFAFGVYMSVCAILSLRNAITLWVTPFLVLFAVGFLYVGITSLVPQRSSQSTRPEQFPRPIALSSNV